MERTRATGCTFPRGYSSRVREQRARLHVFLSLTFQGRGRHTQPTAGAFSQPQLNRENNAQCEGGP
eukprot:8177358-Lingulodinium_polyedra.AAC.1